MIDFTTVATGLATVIAAFAAAIAAWSRAKQEMNSREIRDLRSSNDMLLEDLKLDRDRYRAEIKELRVMIDEAQDRYDQLYKDYLQVKSENVSLRARILNLEEAKLAAKQRE